MSVRVSTTEVVKAGDVNKYESDYSSNLHATVADMSIYVDDATGDDITGDGTAGHPYKTITRAMQDVPYVRRHNVRVHIAAADYSENALKIGGINEHGGTLSLIGVGTSTVVDAGPYTVTEVNPLSAVSEQGLEVVAAAATFTADEHCGMFVEILTGVAAGNMYAIGWNGTTQLYLSNWMTPAVTVGDTFRIVKPTCKLSLNALDIDVNNSAQTSVPNSAEDARFIIANMILDVSSCPANSAPIVIHGDGSIVLDFVQILNGTDHTTYALSIYKSYVNITYCPDAAYISTACGDNPYIGYTAVGATIINDNTAADTYAALLENCWVALLTTSGAVDSLAGTFSYSQSVCGILGLGSAGDTNATLGGQLLIRGQAGGSSAIYVYSMTSINWASFHIFGGGNGIRTSYNATLRMLCSTGYTSCAAGASMTGYSLLCDGIFEVLLDGDMSDFTGNSGAIHSTVPNPDVTIAWPAAGAMSTDGLTGRVVRVG